MLKNPNRKKDGKIFWGIVVAVSFLFATISNKVGYVDVFMLVVLIQIRYDLLEMFWDEKKDEII